MQWHQEGCCSSCQAYPCPISLTPSLWFWSEVTCSHYRDYKTVIAQTLRPWGLGHKSDFLGAHLRLTRSVHVSVWTQAREQAISRRGEKGCLVYRLSTWLPLPTRHCLWCTFKWGKRVRGLETLQKCKCRPFVYNFIPQRVTWTWWSQ